ncbi:RAB6A-GEF complex partner protein 1 isoform X1 [Oopsacas minuta]|uniref:Protein RIC1 homolog n=1 Tax=Oopsacas minuta TaxID=111878 RepID=A0AAV7JZB3_9METZ|nr:RAB6A-GEF complex partner protein 1 isoform X1 [Oopsacas minuta]
MYFPTGWPKVIKLNTSDEDSSYIKPCRHPYLPILILITSRTLQFWDTRNSTLFAVYKRPDSTFDELGLNMYGCWHRDGERFVILTKIGHIIIFAVHMKEINYSENSQTYSKEGIDFLIDMSTIKSNSCDFSLTHFEELVRISFNTIISSIATFGDYIILSTQTGYLHQLDWDGQSSSQMSVNITRLVHHKRDSTATIPEEGPAKNVIIKSIFPSTSPLGMFVIVNDGEVYFLASSDINAFFNDSTKLYYFKGIIDAVDISINYKFKIAAIGCRSGQVQIWKQDVDSGNWQNSHILDNPDENTSTNNQVLSLQWSTGDEKVLAVLWMNGFLSIFSVFGSLISTYDELDMNANPHLGPINWTKDGYSLWLLRQVNSHGSFRLNEFLVFNFLKSALSFLPILSNQENVILHSPTTVYIYPKSTFCKTEIEHQQNMHFCNIIQVERNYIMKNWPIKMVALNERYKYLAVAGSNGLCMCNYSKNKWKLYVNETQEMSFRCNGGIAWWNEILVVSSTTNSSQKNNITFNSLHEKLEDSQTLLKINFPQRVCILDVYLDNLLVLTANHKLLIYHLSKTQLGNKNTLTTDLILNTSYEEYGWSPYNIISASMSTVQTEVLSPVNEFGLASILINVEGYLMMLQIVSHYDLHSQKNLVKSLSPVCIASGVETVFSYPYLPPGLGTQSRPYLSQALWLACGQAGLKIWLPLYPQEDPRNPSYLSKWIMLTIYTRIQPLSVLFEDGTIAGIECDQLHYDKIKRSVAYSLPRRNIQLTVSLILKQLLKRNLNSHAMRITYSCADLPHFDYILEHLIHSVLEEEAAQGAPTANALLPNVIELIRPFPNFIKIVGECARKTEIAVWTYLFGAAGKPKELFELAMEKGNLEIAANYLLIVETIEQPAVAYRLVRRILNACLESSNWPLCTNLIQFIQAIAKNELPQSPISPKVSIPIGNVQLQTTDHEIDFPKKTVPPRVTPKKTHQPQNTPDDKKIPRPQFMANLEIREEEDIVEKVLGRHARRQLTNLNLRELAVMSSNLNFSLVNWLKNEDYFHIKIESYSNALLQLHTLFKWPMPGQRSMGQDSNTNVKSPKNYFNEIEFNDEREIDTLSMTSSVSTKNVQVRSDSGYSLPKVASCFRSEMDQVEVTTYLDSEDHFAELSEEGENNSVDLKHCEKEIKFYKEIFSKSDCHEWHILTGILLLDKHSVVETVSAVMRSADQLGQNRVKGISEGLHDISIWAFHNCNGYVEFLLGMKKLLESMQNYLSDQNVDELKVNRIEAVSMTSVDDSLSPKTPEYDSSSSCTIS